jgi:hypothetical protein
MPIPREKIDAYAAEGFVLNRDDRLPADVVQRALDGMNAIRRGEYDRGRPPEESPWKPGDSESLLCKIENPQFASRGVLELVSHPLIGQWAAALTGAKMVQVWWVQLLYKPPSPPNTKTGTNIGWHQDRSYWKSWQPESEVFTCWVALSDVTLDSGPMMFVPGSHKWGLMNSGHFAEQDLDAIKAKVDVPPGHQWREVPATLPPGGFSLHDDLTWHGSGPNRSSLPRRAFAIHLRTEKSAHIGEKQNSFAKFTDDLSLCPVIYGKL